MAYNQHVINIKFAQYVLTSLLCLIYNGCLLAYVGYKGYLIVKFGSDTIAHPWLLIVYICEIAFCFSSLIGLMEALIPPSKRPMQKLSKNGPFPNVDVFITCCREEIDVIKDTILAVLHLNYPTDKHTIYILDDGKDDNLKAFCEALAVEQGISRLKYLSREKKAGVPHHFKAGNINYGLANTSSEFVVILDADMIVHKDMLSFILPHIMNSEEVAFVQTPQCFYNIRQGDPLCDAQPMWYHNVLVHRDTINAASCCGTGVMFRRTALNSIGGFKVDSITEDALTSIHLLAKGYKSVYLNYKLQMGLTPWTFRGYLAQRDRWARGALQMIKSTLFQLILNPFSQLSLYKRLVYFWYFGSYVMNIVNVVMVSTFMCMIGFNWKPYPGNDIEGRRLLFFITPVMVFWRLYWVMAWVHIPHAFQQRNREEQQFWWMTPYMCEMIISWIFSWFSNIKFISTGSIDGKRGPLRFLLDVFNLKWHIAYVGGALTLIAYRLWKLDMSDCREVIFVLGMSMFLLMVALYMIVPIWCVLFPSSERQPKNRKGLLVYDKEGVPLFDPKRTVPELALNMILYEIITWIIPAIWVGYFVASILNYDVTICEQIRGINAWLRPTS